MLVAVAIGCLVIAFALLAFAYGQRQRIDDWVFEWREARKAGHRKTSDAEAQGESRRPFLAPGHPATQAPLVDPPNALTATELLRSGDHVRAGQMFLALEHFDSAISAFRMAAARDRRFYVEVARICFLKGDLDEGLKACFASGDFVAIAHGCRHAESIARLVEHMLAEPFGDAELRRLGQDFWAEIVASLDTSPQAQAWLERVASRGGDSVAARLARTRLAEDTDSATETAPLSHVC